ncbi:RnfABCDGE type electron transport complex subunit B [Zongyangia hominis]|uniref:Ion-translocating oxidoreductase complex subunit B n=1 Tax=Zongyangia hominis TaxID=2763677 RepID=A0A926I5W7_9FIRM|nr:RnfABCDGE type electron transport complex subunit B [Zongyangia hominis]MBC8569339.1 RnfABCDGE type electron transport complex subunit B [Zongyangia hominis]
MFTTIVLPILILTALGLLAGLLLALAAKFMAVKTDPKFDQIREVLPGANCGACGYAGCDAYAKALAGTPGIKTNLCVPGGDKTSRAISAVLGVDFADVEEVSAMVKCGGDCDATDYIMEYRGPQTCSACNTFYQGRGKCSHACLGFGDCVAVCMFDAIHIVNGVAVVDKEKCTGCGMCSRECPNALIEMRPAGNVVFVGCSSHDKGAFTRKVCANGCIGCKKCEKVCPTGAAKVTDNLAAIDPKTCINCRACEEACPTGAIRSYPLKK